MTYGPKESRNWSSLFWTAAVLLIAYLVLSGIADFLAEHARVAS